MQNASSACISAANSVAADFAPTPPKRQHVSGTKTAARSVDEMEDRLKVITSRLDAHCGQLGGMRARIYGQAPQSASVCVEPNPEPDQSALSRLFRQLEIIDEMLGIADNHAVTISDFV